MFQKDIWKLKSGIGDAWNSFIAAKKTSSFFEFTDILKHIYENQTNTLVFKPKTSLRSLDLQKYLHMYNNQTNILQFLKSKTPIRYLNLQTSYTHL